MQKCKVPNASNACIFSAACMQMYVYFAIAVEVGNEKAADFPQPQLGWTSWMHNILTYTHIYTSARYEECCTCLHFACMNINFRVFNVPFQPSVDTIRAHTTKTQAYRVYFCWRIEPEWRERYLSVWLIATLLTCMKRKCWYLKMQLRPRTVFLYVIHITLY